MLGCGGCACACVRGEEHIDYGAIKIGDKNADSNKPARAIMMSNGIGGSILHTLNFLCAEPEPGARERGREKGAKGREKNIAKKNQETWIKSIL